MIDSLARRYGDSQAAEFDAIDTALSCIDDPETRGFFLHRLADLYAGDGLPLEADLFHMVAATEDAIGTAYELTPEVALLHFRRERTSEEEFGLWCDLATVQDRRKRADVVVALRPYIAKRTRECVSVQLAKVMTWERAVAGRTTPAPSTCRACRFSRWVRRWFR